MRAFATGLVLLLCAALPCSAADPDALWKIVHGECVPHQRAAQNPTPKPCEQVSGGAAVLKDNSPSKPTHFLLIPTQREEGIESPDILAPAAPDYWQEAWGARHFVAERAGRPLARDEIGLAINSRFGRTQDQLHIHIDCIAPDVREILSKNQGGISRAWTELPVPLRGHRYRVMRVAGEELRGARPFVLVSRSIPGAARHMEAQTIVVTGAVFSDGTPGFYVLEDAANSTLGDVGSGEELLRSCAHG